MVTAGAFIGGGLIARLAAPGLVAADALMIAAAVVAGLPIALTAVRALRTGTVGIEALVTIAAVGAVLIGNYWEAAAVTFLFDLGGYLEARTMARTRRVIGELLDLTPPTAIVLRGERRETVPAEEVALGDAVVVKPGSRVPVDGTVTAGSSRVDESAITGEPMPQGKVPGSRVFAGTVNQNAVLTIRTTRVAGDTTLARIVERVEDAQETKAPTQRFIERFARWYTPSIVVLAVGAIVVTGDVELALTVLVIGCPGALVISTPVSIVAGIGGAAREGILMKGGSYLERSGRITAVALDKTGTLTRGRPAVTNVTWAPSTAPTPVGHRVDPLRMAAIAEAGSDHPIGGCDRAGGPGATAAATAAATAPAVTVPPPSYVPPPVAEEMEDLPGLGVSAVYRGQRILVGRPALLERRGVAIDGDAAPADPSGTTVHVAVDGVHVGAMTVADPIRTDGADAIAMLRRAGVSRIVMLTGDTRAAAESVADAVGIDEVHAELMPEEKLEHIAALQGQGHVTAMIGDGINDAPALATADIGIAVGAGGTDVAIETADIALLRDDLILAARAIDRSHRTLANIRQNVVVALITVGVLLVGVMTSRVHMAGGMLIHEASVLAVILNGTRLLGGRDAPSSV